jgi:hypothetical protein
MRISKCVVDELTVFIGQILVMGWWSIDLKGLVVKTVWWLQFGL